jgi:hypothetical protein
MVCMKSKIILFIPGYTVLLVYLIKRIKKSRVAFYPAFLYLKPLVLNLSSRFYRLMRCSALFRIMPFNLLICNVVKRF